MGQYDTIVENNRICYVDPNNIRGDGTPLTPDYTNFSIWCNLIVERSSRLKNTLSGVDDNQVFVASFDMTRANNGTEYVSFMQGKDAEIYNFLTTDYTNIDFKEVKKRNIIEGLQISSINISFTNYQTPQVTIKFVDIRGGGFFGREEATHSEYGSLKNLESDNNKMFDNFFGCFVTFPYPRFRLQVKGFYGRDVTYQLTCTSFNGNFNSQTGNFEIVVQFIGYEYGILGDIPFDLLVAAPLTPDGNEYWNEHVANMEKNGWALDKEKTEKPIKLYDFYNNISKQLQTSNPEDIDSRIVDDGIEEKMVGILQQMNKLKEIKDCIQEFKKCIRNTFKEYYVTECETKNSSVIIIHNPTEEFTQTGLLNDLCDKRNNIGDLVEEYNKEYGELPLSIIPNNSLNRRWEKWDSKKINLKFTKLIEHIGLDTDKNRNNHKNVVVALNTSNRTVNAPVNDVSSFIGFKIGKFYTTENYVVTESVSQKLYDTVTTNNWAVFGKDIEKNIAYARYALVIDMGGVVHEINDRISKLNYTQKVYEKKINNVNKMSIKDIVGFTPYIGRYFKIVMCHLETFIHLIYNCADIISGQVTGYNREPNKLGIHNLTIETDVPGNVYKQVPPFPAVYRKYNTDDGVDNEMVKDDSEAKTNAWVGDFKGSIDWQEKKLVEDLYFAAQKISEKRRVNNIDNTSANSVTCNSLLPIDYFVEIPQYAYATLDGLKFYAGIRAYILLYMMGGGKIYNGDSGDSKNLNDCKLKGMYDAYVYLSQKPKNVSLKDLVGGENLTKNGIYNSLVYCDEFKGKKSYDYEMYGLYQTRNPMFIIPQKEVTPGVTVYTTKVLYNYIYANNEKTVAYVPLYSLPTLSGHSFTQYFKNVTGNGTFSLVEPDSDKFLYTGGGIEPKHLNTHHFEIIMSDEIVSLIKKNFDDCNNGTFEIYGKSSKEFAGALNHHLLLDDNRYNKFYDFTSVNGYEKTYKDVLGKDIDEYVKDTNFDTIKNKFLEIAQ